MTLKIEPVRPLESASTTAAAERTNFESKAGCSAVPALLVEAMVTFAVSEAMTGKVATAIVAVGVPLTVVDIVSEVVVCVRLLLMNFSPTPLQSEDLLMEALGYKTFGWPPSMCTVSWPFVSTV